MTNDFGSVQDASDPLDRVRARQRTALRWLRSLGFAVVLLVIAGSLWSPPRPGLHGHNLAILVALTCFSITTVLANSGRELDERLQILVYAALVLAAGTLVWQQPRGLAFVGLFVGVTVAAMRLHGRSGAGIAVLALLTLAAAQIFAGRASPVTIANGEVGIVAFYVLGVLGYRLREGQEQAERLLAEIEASRDAETQAAALAERARLAREMHDVLAHSLSGLTLQLAGAELLTVKRGADADITAAISRAHHLARAGLEEARRAIGMLREDALPSPDRLAGLTNEFERDTGVPCLLSVAGEESNLSSEAQLTLYRAVQEALTNVRRHAAAERVEVGLNYKPDGVCLSVEDYGECRPCLPTPGDGYGLTGMRERVELLGGNLVAGPTGTGFRVQLWMPA